jgi:integrase
MSGRRFGSVRQLPRKGDRKGRPTGRWQARYRAPDGRSYTARTEDDRPLTFATAGAAGRWLDRVSAEIQAGTWRAPGSVAAPVTFGAYATAWLADRELSPTTADLYRRLLRHHLLPTFADVQVAAITPASVRTWHASLTTGPTARSHAYGLLRTILGTAVDDDLLPANPCRIRGAGSVKRAKVIRPATLAELDVIVENMPERYRALVLLAAWCGLRWGELTELRRADLDLDSGVVHVERGVVRTRTNGRIVKAPKSQAGIRDVSIPPHLLPAIREHLASHAQVGARGLLFPAAGGGHLALVTFGRYWTVARMAAGRPDLTIHGLRHTGATLAAATGATLAELMARMGHSTPTMAMRYQHASSDRDATIAALLSDLATGATVTPIRERQRA